VEEGYEFLIKKQEVAVDVFERKLDKVQYARYKVICRITK